jgi:AraC family transcriptional regulator of adaptative response/methylated-DNA-[protein]-cysteine methyltransferase
MEICKTNDANYDGLFFMGVKSTGIFCIASCTAKFPLMKNITFFDTMDEALNNGFRGCQRCHSASRGLRPTWLLDAIAYLTDNIDKSLVMQDLESYTGKHRTTILKEFKKYYHHSPMQYFRQLKMDAARNRIMKGEDYRDVAFGLGYESISGFRTSFKKSFGVTPGSVSK